MAPRAQGTLPRIYVALAANRTYTSVVLADLTNAMFLTDEWMNDECESTLDELGKRSGRRRHERRPYRIRYLALAASS